MKWPFTGRDTDLDHAADLVESGLGVAILGHAGVGKSRLLGELFTRIEASGVATMRTVATEATRTVPFGAFVNLLPSVPTQDRLALFDGALTELKSRVRPSGLVLGVDDAHYLDEGSLALLSHVVASDIVTVVLTGRAGENMPSELVNLWTDSRIERIDIEPLDPDATVALVEAALGKIETGLADELWRLTSGNPLLLHEVVEGAIGRSIQLGSDEVWALTDRLGTSARLADLIRARMNAVPDDLRAALELVAIGAPLDRRILVEAIGDSLSRLEDGGLVTTTMTDVGALVRPAHPLYGEVLKTTIGESRIREANGELVKAVLRLPDAPDPLRAAIWQRDAARMISPDLALRGAQVALSRHDPILAEELLMAADTSDVTVAVMLGRARNYQSRFKEAEVLLANVAATLPGDIVEHASVRANNLAFGLRRVGEAASLLRVAAETVGDDSLRARLDTERGMILAITGDFHEALGVSRRVLDNPAATAVARTSAYASLILAQSMTADCDGVADGVGEALVLADRCRTELPLAEFQIRVLQVNGLVFAGRIADGVKIAEGCAADAVPGMRATWATTQALALDLAGRVSAACDILSAASGVISAFDPLRMEHQTRGFLAFELGQLNNPTAARVLDGIVVNPDETREALWLERGRAWVSAVAGDRLEASRIAAETGSNAVERQHAGWAALAFHDAVRFGHAELVASELSAIDSRRGALLIVALQDHARAQVAGDPKAMLEVGNSLASMGAFVLAAEAAAQAAAIQHRAGLTSDAARAALVSLHCESRCEGADTPALQSRPVLISEREFEIALDAAEGLTSSAIAERRFISVRTVDNHLRSIYKKIGASGREELASLLPAAAASQ